MEEPEMWESKKRGDEYINEIHFLSTEVTEDAGAKEFEEQVYFSWKTKKAFENHDSMVLDVEISTLRFHLSFKKDISNESSQFLANYAQILNFLGVMIGNLEDARLELDACNYSNLMDTIPNFANKLKRRYINSLLKSLPDLLGSLNSLGNPAKVVHDFQMGLGYFFKDSVRGDEEEAGGINAAKSELAKIGNFLRCSMMGLSGFGKNLTGAVADGASTLIDGDAAYNKHRIMSKISAKGKPGETALKGVENLGYSIFDSIMGIFTKPAEQVNKSTAAIFAGVFRGTTDLAIKPVIGTLDTITAGFQIIETATI
jgi:vacuolar protein sorting-associated protein 13A/C